MPPQAAAQEAQMGSCFGFRVENGHFCSSFGVGRGEIEADLRFEMIVVARVLSSGGR